MEIKMTSPTQAWKARRDEKMGDFVDFDRLQEAIEEGELEHSDAVFAMELTRRTDLSTANRRAFFVAVLGNFVSRRRGSVRLDLSGHGGDDLATALGDLLPTYLESADTTDIANRIGTLFCGDLDSELVGSPGDYKPLVVDNGQLYRHADLVEERRLADALSDRIDASWRGPSWPTDTRFGQGEVSDALERAVATGEPTPTPQQQYAIATAATSDLSVITGGPGTGKTSLIVSLLRLLAALDVEPEDVALAAPTGKAADRLGAAIDGQLVDGSDLDERIAEQLQDPSTIHRLLGYSERSRDFYHDAFRPLPHRYIIVDEASMIDLALMDRLVAAVDERARLVLVGDADQLPAVGSGAVFRDLVPEQVHTATPRRNILVGDPIDEMSSPEPMAAQSMRLTTNFRMREGDPAGSNVLSVAQAVRDGGRGLEFGHGRGEGAVTRRTAFDALEFEGAEILTGTSGGWIESWYDRLIADDVLKKADWQSPLDFENGAPTESTQARLDALFEAYETYQLLGVTRRRPRGVENLDAQLHRLHVSRLNGYKPDLAIGEPVMMTRNDYERNLFNGDRGLILNVRDDATGRESRRAVFPTREGYTSFAIQPLKAHLDHAWALTVHKSQGSEYDSVGIVLPSAPIPLATRELLYTGITRARRSVTFFGRPQLVYDAAKRSDDRNTGLVERLERAVR
jgi:exodeoxyribonuclease V alpha subunit